MAGRHEKKKEEAHVHRWQYVYYDAAMGKSLWMCAVKCDNGKQAQAWLPPGEHPDS